MLGPILFVIYLNDLLNLDCYGSIVSYADDTVLFVEGETWNEIQTKINEDLNKITKWFDNNLLTINLSKTMYIPFSSYKRGLLSYKTIEINLRHRNTIWTLKNSEYVKYLGILVDNHLRWNHHIENLVKKLRSLSYMFQKLKYILNIHELKSVYFALVQSLLTYGIIGWGGAYSNVLKPLEIIQKRILKIIFNFSVRFPTEELFKDIKICDLRNLFYLNILTNMSKHKLFSDPSSHIHNTRHKAQLNLLLPKKSKTIGQRVYHYIGIKLYNLLPPELKQIIYKKSTKTKLRHWILENKFTLL